MAPSRLAADSLQAGYGRKQVLFEVSLNAAPGEIVAVVGHNGAGKTTLLNVIAGLLPARAGDVRLDGRRMTGLEPWEVVRHGMCVIPAENFVFSDLTVADNLLLGMPADGSRRLVRERLERVETLFPVLAERAAALAGTLSGGQQRMLSIGMALMRDPRVLLLDEPSLGLAPALVGRLFEKLRNLASSSGHTVVLVEQNLPQAFAISDRVYVMRAGRIIAESSAAEMRGRDHYWDLF